MKPYIKPTFEYVALKLDERLAKCCDNGNGNSANGQTPGAVLQCPGSASG